jgi:dephospho-CoA kinase
MLVIGLTGGIGSGKSTVADLFAKKHNIPIIDADIVERDVTTPDKPAFARIIKHFGTELVMQDGKLDRAKLRQIIFNDPQQRLWLENLLHPLILAEMEQQIEKLTAPYCIAVIPLLLEVEFLSFINRILVVDAPETEQIKRVMQRDNTTQSEVEAILKNQANREIRLAKAQDVITNDGKMEDLILQVDALDKKYRLMVLF